MAVATDDQTRLDALLERNERRPELLIQVLQDLQREFGYLPEDGLRYVANELAVPLNRVYHVATFYKSFSLEPRGKHLVSVCRGTACHVRGAERLVETIQRELGIQDGQTTTDQLFTLECVNCLGACALAPVVVIDAVYYEKVTPDRLRGILKEYRDGNGAKGEEGTAEAPPEPAPAPEAPVEPEVAAAPEPAPAAAEEPAPEAPAAPSGPGKKKLSRIERKIRRKEKKGKGRKN